MSASRVVFTDRLFKIIHHIYVQYIIFSEVVENVCMLLLRAHSGRKFWVSQRYQCLQVRASHQDSTVDQKQPVLQ